MTRALKMWQNDRLTVRVWETNYEDVVQTLGNISVGIVVESDSWVFLISTDRNITMKDTTRRWRNVFPCLNNVLDVVPTLSNATACPKHTCDMLFSSFKATCATLLIFWIDHWAQIIYQIYLIIYSVLWLHSCYLHGYAFLCDWGVHIFFGLAISADDGYAISITICLKQFPRFRICERSS